MLFKILVIMVVLGLTTASLSGPYLLWGQEKLHELQTPALQDAAEQNLVSLFKESKAVVVFLRNSTSRLEGSNYPKFQQYVKANTWAYLPQHSLAVEPFNYNANVEVIPLSGIAEQEDDELMTGFNDAITIYGEGEVLGIIASHEEDTHFLSKREVQEGAEEDLLKPTTTQSTLPEETDKSFIYVADGKKAVLYVNAETILNISESEESIKLVEHHKPITFDDQRAKGYGRLNIIFKHNNTKIFLRFNFTLAFGSWSMKSVEVEYRKYKVILPIVGNSYTVPSAPLGFSYRCSSENMLFGNGSESLVLQDYQIQPWLNGSSKFGDVYDCVGFTTSPIWAGQLVSFFLLGILSLGILALMDIKTPNRFESSRSKQLTFTVQE